MDEQKKYEVIKKLVDDPENASKTNASLKLGLSRRQVDRLIAAYRKRGKAAFSHGNKGRKPVTTIPEETRKKIIELFKTSYNGANFVHFKELLDRHEDIHVSVSSIANILEAEYILSPKATRAKKKRVKKELRQMAKAATPAQAEALRKNLVAIEDAHSRRPRCKYIGELEQMDATPFEWIPGQTWHLHVAIDDASGMLTGAWFDTQETLQGYYHVLHQILTNHGIPYKIFTDRRTVFTYKQKNSPSLDEDTYTQFAYACKQLDIALESSSVPQAKGRVERVNQTLQSRLPIELRLNGISTIEQANEFLHRYVKEFNEKFALPTQGIISTFETQPEAEKINLILAVLTERTVDNGHCIQFRKHYYRLVDAHGIQIHYQKGTKVMVVQAYDGKLYCCVNDRDIYALEEIPLREKKSKELDHDYKKPTAKKHYIPPMNHPWRRSLFRKFVNSQEHHRSDDLPA